MPANIPEPEDGQSVVLGAARSAREVDELEAEVLDLQAKVLDIQSQLANKDRTYPDGHEFAGRRMTEHDYHRWRAKAVAAMSHISADLRAAKADLRDAKKYAAQERARQKSDWLERQGPNSEAMKVLRIMAKRAISDYGLIPTPREQRVLDFLQNLGGAHQGTYFDGLEL